MELQLNLWRSFLKVGLFKYASEMVAFLGSIVISRLLAPSEYGVVAMIAVGYLFIARFSNPGYTDLIIREPDSASFKSEMQWVFVIHGMVLALVMAALAFPISWFFQDSRLLIPGMVYGLILFLYALPGASESFLAKKKRFTDIFKIEFLGSCLGVVLTILLAYWEFSYWALILPHLIIPWGYLIIYQKWEPVPWSTLRLAPLRRVFVKIKSLVWQLSKVNLVEYWEEQTDNFWIGRIYGSSVLGVYNRAYLVAHLPRALFKPLVNSVLLPQWQQYKDQRHKVGEAYGDMLQLILAALAFPMAVVIIFPHELSVWLWGQQWEGVAPLLGVLGLIMGFQVVCSTSRAVFLLMGHEKLYSKYAWWQGSLMIIIISISVFYSVKLMILALTLVTLIFKVPAYAYWCLHKSLGFNFDNVFKILGVPWVICLLIWILMVLQGSQSIVLLLGLLIFWSLRKFYQHRELIYGLWAN